MTNLKKLEEIELEHRIKVEQEVRKIVKLVNTMLKVSFAGQIVYFSRKEQNEQN